MHQLRNVVRQNVALSQAPIIPVEVVQQCLGGAHGQLPSFDEARRASSPMPQPRVSMPRSTNDLLMRSQRCVSGSGWPQSPNCLEIVKRAMMGSSGCSWTSARPPG